MICEVVRMNWVGEEVSAQSQHDRPQEYFLKVREVLLMVAHSCHPSRAVWKITPMICDGAITSARIARSPRCLAFYDNARSARTTHLYRRFLSSKSWRGV